MNLEELVYIRHEVLLTAVTVLILTAGSVRKIFNAYTLSITATGLFMVLTWIGFLRAGDGIAFGGMLLSSPLPLIMKNILNVAVLIILFFSFKHNSRQQDLRDSRDFYFLIFISLAGMYLMISAGHFLVFYLGIELALLPVTALVKILKNKNDLPAPSGSMIHASLFSSLIILFGISITYGVCGTLYFSKLITINMNNTLQVLAFFAIFGGILIKILILPYYLIREGMEERHPSGLLSLSAIIISVSGVFILLILLFSIFPSVSLLWQKTIFYLTIAGLTAGNIITLRQKKTSRFLAWSSLVQTGYILTGIIGASPLAMTSIISSSAAYIFSAMGLYVMVMIVKGATGSDEIADFRGLYHSNRGLGLSMTIALLSLAAIPPFAGFFGRFFVFASAAEKGFYFFLLVISANTLLTLFYYLNIIRIIFTEDNTRHLKTIKSPLSTRLALIICIAGILLAGIAGILFDKLNGFSFGV
ncbi:MAG TPA: proton-conducting transporter membrane subunit [Bacteroidales bacterium]|nr:proton-conducting transporter membrane subunit [Bacteroidales bacterium]HPJ59537.1 proton-conducting transporter membrane subunit [Bacteroidales bacterium]HPR12074.1 proton-conducting transporter membrane subunit [Bacteroidales bacterium]HRW86194.1 proton-conducting transporter membrane subunit [Bacteroidales bacterium]